MDRRRDPSQPFDLQKIIQEAQHRWLRPAEICEILSHHQQFQLTAETPTRPPAGSLFLFDRKALRYYRKDGHRWRKKKDGKTVREAHEKLKAGSVDVLHCYYAHGEDNGNFQRRSYWMLDLSLDRIVLVHYREVKEGCKAGVSSSNNEELGVCQANPAVLAHEKSPSTGSSAHPSFIPSHMTAKWNGQSSMLDQSVYKSLSCAPSRDPPGISENRCESDAIDCQAISSVVTPNIQICRASKRETLWGELKSYIKPSNGGDFNHEITDARLDSSTILQDVGYELSSDAEAHEAKIVEKYSSSSQNQHLMFLDTLAVPSTGQVNGQSPELATDNYSLRELQKLDSFGRWMHKELGKDCDDSLMGSESGKYWNTLDNEIDDKEVSSFSHHMQLDIDSCDSSLLQEHLFTICDISPDWAYSGTDTKVLIAGTFMDNAKGYKDRKWSCMFGETEVLAEVLNDHVIRCRAPSLAPGSVPFYITCTNRLACSDIYEFQYHEKPCEPSSAGICSSEDEIQFQVRWASMLFIDEASKWPNCSWEVCDKCRMKQDLCSIWSNRQIEQRKIEEAILSIGKFMRATDLLTQRLLEDRLYRWLVHMLHEGDKRVRSLDKLGQGVIHLAAALGYEWAMRPIIAAGISPNFRDARGRTALHWASYYGREETVIALVKLGAAPGAVEDPTAAFPGGQKAADLASNRGHKGIAGFLAEADLTSHLCNMNNNNHVQASGLTTTVVQNTIDSIRPSVLSSVGVIEEEVSMRKPLDAVRNSAHAAALIHAGFRARSFHQRQSTRVSKHASEAPPDLVLRSLHKVQKKNRFDDSMHGAAVKIQQKYRGWKGRKEFIKIRNRIVNIQAHYRGHRVRKQYKKIVWSVGIVEKAILRWRRKGSGLRGFRAGKRVENTVVDTGKPDEYDFLRIGREQKFAGVEIALSRVKSMVRYPEARDQYMRLLSRFENFKIDNNENGCAIINKDANTQQKELPFSRGGTRTN